MAWTTPKTWAALAILTGSEMNVYIRDNLNYLKSVADGLSFSGIQVERTSAQSIPDSTMTQVVWQAAEYEYGDYWTSGASVTVPAEAIPDSITTVAFYVSIYARFVANGTGSRMVKLLKDGTQFQATSVSAISGETTDLSCADFAFGIDGTIFTAEVYQSSGGALNMDVCTLTVVRFAPVA